MNTHKFTGKAENYERFRPSYPLKMIDSLYQETGFNSSSLIADIGSGTGKFSELLLERKSSVIGIEPNADMRKTAEKRLTHFADYISSGETAEETKLASSSVDFVTAAQAFHWFDVKRFKEECRRILKPEGKVVLIWNSRVMKNKLIQENEKICREYCEHFNGFSGGIEKHLEVFSVFFKEGSYDEQLFENNQLMDREAFIGRNLSASYAPEEGARNYEKFVKELSILFEKYCENENLLIPSVTKCYIGKV